MKEDEAKTKWCPMANVSCASVPCEGNHSANRWEDSLPDNGYCIASDCMMWVWGEAFDRDDNGELTGHTNYNTEGRCGLAQ